MKQYGFKITDGHGTFTRWFSSNGKFDGELTQPMNRVIIAQQFLAFHQAYACAKAAASNRDMTFIPLYEDDFKESRPGGFFKRLLKYCKADRRG
jgi:hypothetical protein